MVKLASVLALSGTLLSCATDGRSRCQQAADALSECTGSVPEGFVEACEADTDADTAAFTDSLLEASCDGNAAIGGKEDGHGEALFVTACSALVGAAYVSNRVRSPTPVALTRALKDALRPEFGALVDDIRVSWNAKLVDEWDIGSLRVVLGFDVGAQTFGNTIFMSHAYDATNPRLRIVTLAHELTHARQAQQRGGVLGFARAYCRAFWDASYSYRENALEQEAYALANGMAKCLRSGATTCKAP